ncbi:hypothetical protein IV203_005492 [Nitzschia inconspicua]|uniref:DUF6824 domain-containing protein n=1 Tax=Nitzschia inconspicua TaxID=303405 RepID=A0A9K3PIS3_9STRA|nr:hypothetical protein IV203_005492 [Nitzschia inconspicua]
MQNATDWGLQAEGSSSTGHKAQPSGSNFGTMAAVATSRPMSFPQPPSGFFQLYGPGAGYIHSNYPSNNWGMMNSCYEQPQGMVYEFTPSPQREIFVHQPKPTIIMSGITSPHENDVLMGRGGKNNQFCGNEKLRLLARKRCREYQTASKKGKSQISRELVDAIRLANPPGRFLKKVEDGTWEDVGDETAREKTSQVLRDAINSVKTFSNMPAIDLEVTTPDVAPRTIARPAPNAVTHEKSTPLQRPTSTDKARFQPSSATSDDEIPSLHGWSNAQTHSPMPFVPYRGPNTHQLMRYSSGCFPSAQYQVTPSTGIIDPPSAARKRARYHESPLVAGYHRAPGFYASDNASAYGTPNISYMYGSPPNPRKQGFSYTPPTMQYRATAFPANDGATPSTPVLSSGQSAAGQPSGESSDCWINDVPTFQSHQKSAAKRQPQQEQEVLGASDFDPFNDDLLSDSEHRDGSPFLFP